jgi:hypothetical protein
MVEIEHTSACGSFTSRVPPPNLIPCFRIRLTIALCSHSLSQIRLPGLAHRDRQFVSTSVTLLPSTSVAILNVYCWIDYYWDFWDTIHP